MKLLSWNCQGINPSLTVRNLKDFVRKNRPEIIFLMGTKAKLDKLESLKRSLGMYNHFTVDPIGLSGGLCVFGLHSICLNIMSAGSHIINATIDASRGLLHWEVSFVYASKGQSSLGIIAVGFALIKLLPTLVGGLAPHPTGPIASSLHQNIQRCEPTFRKWNWSSFGHLQSRIKKLREDLLGIQSLPFSDDNQAMEEVISFNLAEALKLEEKFKLTLDDIISYPQSAFVSVRSISENVFMAHKLFHYIRQQKKGKIKLAAIKLDMKKAYDRLEGGFIEGILKRFGFSSHWIKMCMQCLPAAHFKVLINGIPQGHICAQALSSVFSNAENIGEIHEWILLELSNLKKSLDLYCRASGQAINLVKSSIIFSPNTHHRICRWLSKSLNLGLPVDFGQSKKTLFKGVRDRTLNLTGGWKSKLLSHSARETLIKSEAFAIPTYSGSHFKIPASIHCDLNKKNLKRKFTGSLGIAIYFPRSSFLDARLGSSPSWGCEVSWMAGSFFLLVYLGSNGRSVRIRGDRWIPSLPNQMIPSPKAVGCDLVWVSEIIDHPNRCWNRVSLAAFFPPLVEAAILSIPLSLVECDDHLFWGEGNSSTFSVKRAYHLTSNHADQLRGAKPSSSTSRAYQRVYDKTWKFIWRIKTLPNIWSFLWRCCADGVAVGEGFQRQHMRLVASCARCGSTLETPHHVLVACPFAKAVWFGSSVSVWADCDPSLGLEGWLESWKNLPSPLQDQAKPFSPEEVIRKAQSSFDEFCLVTAPGLHSPLSTPACPACGGWSLPPSGFIKVNSDAAVLSSKKAGVGFVARNSLGEVLAAVSEPIPYTSPLIAESLGLRSATLRAISKGWPKVIFGCDS
ncbi:uncharacterized protein LOC122064115 [Macadamia integrifolia]|uniref:uncharacterized protein LOC122064115 n=1 Tax=Macadamia integrifolia TaxID=60698 RepID=UPI001C4F30A6|nr:uncharacterized protein LOC122064115 [Macadamia integrifolia]